MTPGWQGSAWAQQPRERRKECCVRAERSIPTKGGGRFLATHTTSGITSGASMVNHLWEQEATAETEHGRDVHALVVEEE